MTLLRHACAQNKDLSDLLQSAEGYCTALSENLAPRRAVKQVLEQRPYLRALTQAVAEAVRAPDPTVKRVLCLGGSGITAVAARRLLVKPSKVTCVQPTENEDASWRMMLARMVSFVNSFDDLDCLTAVPDQPWDILAVEGLDTYVLADGMLRLMQAAAPHASPGACVVPRAARVCAVLCAARDFSSCAGTPGNPLDMSAVCGEEALCATAPWLLLDEDNALLQDAVFLTEPFEALKLWCPDSSASPDAAPFNVSDSDESHIIVSCSSPGRCTAVVYWWETQAPECKSSVRAVQWLPRHRDVVVGDDLSVVATRSLTRIHFTVEGCDCQPKLESLSLAALRHAPMLRDQARNECYASAIARAVQRAKQLHGTASVLEIGSGTGVLMMMAKQAGANRITGCEVDTHVCELAVKAARDNRMPFQGAGSDFDLVPVSLQAAATDPALRGQFNVVIAELMDDSGLGESMWPFIAQAREQLVTPGIAPVVIPQRIRIFAALVNIEVLQVAGVQTWPLDPYWFCSTVPNLPAVGRSMKQVGLDLDLYKDHWEPVSNVIEVFCLDLTTIDGASCKEGKLNVDFTVVRDSAMNGVVWFWQAELDEETTLVTTPNKFWNQYGHYVPGGAQRGSRHCWKQASQALGPLWVSKGQIVQATAEHDTVWLNWSIDGFDPNEMQGKDLLPLFRHCEIQRGLKRDNWAEVAELTKAWFEAMGTHDPSRDEMQKIWTSRQWSLEEKTRLLEVFRRFGDFGVHPTLANHVVPLFFGSVTTGVVQPELSRGMLSVNIIVPGVTAGGRLGLGLDDASDALGGIIVVQVASEVEKHGWQLKDRIVEVNGKKIIGWDDFRGAWEEAKISADGGEVNFVVLREIANKASQAPVLECATDDID